MRIVFVTQWYHPEPVRVICGCAEALSEMGHDVTVITGFPNYPSGKLFQGYRLRLFQRETINGVSVVRVPLFPSHDSSALKRIINYTSFALSASLLTPFLIRRPQIVHVYLSPLTAAWPGWILSRLFRTPLTCEIQDMWPETLAATRMVRSRTILRLVAWCARLVYARASAIRVITNGFAANLRDKGVPARKIHIIPNWAVAGKASAYPRDDKLATRVGLPNQFTVMFAGNIGQAQDLGNVLDAAAILKNVPDVQFAIVGDGIDLERLQGRKRAEKLANVFFLGRYPSDEMPTLYALADVLLVHLRDDPLFRITIPHKTYGYMASGKPILAAVEGDVADTIKSARAGITCRAGDPTALAEAVCKLRNMTPDERRAMGNNGRRTIEERHSRDYVANQLIKMLMGVTSHFHDQAAAGSPSIDHNLPRASSP